MQIAVGRIREADNNQKSLDASKWGNSRALKRNERKKAPGPTIIPTTDGYHHPFIQTYEPSVARIIEECSNNSGEKKIKLQREHIVVREYLNIIIKDQEVQWTQGKYLKLGVRAIGTGKRLTVHTCKSLITDQAELNQASKRLVTTPPKATC